MHSLDGVIMPIKISDIHPDTISEKLLLEIYKSIEQQNYLLAKIERLLADEKPQEKRKK